MRKFLFLFVLVVLISFHIHAVNIDLNNNDSGITMLESSYSELTINVKTANFTSADISTKLGEFTLLRFPGAVYSQQIGSPKLPVYRELIELPQNAVANVTILSYEAREILLADYGITNPIIPAQAPADKSIPVENLEFIQNETEYMIDSYTETTIADVEEIGTLRAVRLGRLTISPVRYNPVNNSIIVYTDIDLSIEFENADIAKTIYEKQKARSPYFGVNHKNILNYQPLAERDEITEYPIKYVIISDPMFEDVLEPFIEWKKKKGFTVITAYTSDPGVGSTTTSISAYLHGLWNDATPESPAHSFVLFVGDTGEIPAFNGNQASHPTDLYYADYTNDNVPDTYYGRFSATNVNELLPQINKTLEYEKYEMADPSFLDEVVMIAGYDTSHGSTWGNGQINYGTTYYFNEAHGLTSHTYLYPESSSHSDDIIQNVSDGVGYVNYTAHGGVTNWVDPSFEFSDIDGLQNEGKYPLMVGNCCLTNTFDEFCFGEKLLRAENKGALGYIGGSNTTYWDPDYYWGVGSGPIIANPTYEETTLGAYDRTFHDHGEGQEEWFPTQGSMIVAGNLAVEVGDPGSAFRYWEIYHLMGDPSVMIYFSQPPLTEAEFLPLLPIGMDEFTVTTSPNALVAISANGVLHGATVSDENGIANIQISPFLEACMADIVITGQNIMPVQTQVQVAVPAVITVEPESLPISTATTLTVTIVDGDGAAMPGVNCWIDGIGDEYDTTPAATNTQGEVQIDITYPYGDEVLLLGKRPEDNYILFTEILDVTGGLDTDSPDFTVENDFNLEDAFVAGIDGTITFNTDAAEYRIWAKLNDQEEVYSENTPLIFNPDETGTVMAIFTREGYNMYDESFEVIEATGTLCGQITDPGTSAPIAGIEVMFFERNADIATEDCLFSAFTDDNGNYTITEPKATAYYNIYIETFGYEIYYEEDFILGIGNGNIKDIQLSPASPSTVSGTIATEGGTALQSLVRVYRLDTNELYAQTLAEDGNYVISIPDFAYSFKVNAQGFKAHIETIFIDGNTTQDFTLFESSGVMIIDGETNDDNNGAEIITAALNDMEVSNTTVTPTEAVAMTDWNMYEGIIYTCGLNPGEDAGLTAELQNTILDFASSGGNVWVEGSRVGFIYSYLEDSFLEQILHEERGGGAYSAITVKDSEHQIAYFPNELPETITYNGESSADGTRVTCTDDADVVFDWDSAPNRSSINCNGEKTVFTSFLINKIADEDVRDNMIMNIAAYLGFYVPMELDIEESNILAIAPRISKLGSNVPNPFNPVTSISYELAAAGSVKLSIYNVKGQLVKELVNEDKAQGYHSVVWNGKDTNGYSVSSGIYFYRLETNETTETKKMLLLK